MCDGIEDASFKACLYEVSQPSLPGLAARYRASSAFVIFFLLTLLLCLYVKAGKHA